MKYIQFQQSGEPDHQRPWPVIASEVCDVIYGRPDAHHLVGFGPVDSFDITVTTARAIENPELAVGLAPVFQCRGEMFSVGLPVTSCAPFEADAARILELAEREAAMRKTLES